MSTSRVEEIFLSALDLPVEKRAAYLARACGSDRSLQREVQSLLAASADVSVLFPSPIAAPDRPVPEVIGSYSVSGRLGSGGMGEVYLAHDPRLERAVAIKIIPNDLTEDPDLALRFKREAQILATLNHPHIATIYSLEQLEDGRHFLTMEWIDGLTLTERLQENPFSDEDALSVCRQVALALEAAHERDVIHRDLKPANVMVTSSGHVKVLDFGLAKRTTAAGGPAEFETRPGIVMGTLGYMSPEQLRGEDVGPATDLWAFGCLLFECLSGQQAFRGETVPERIAATLSTEPDWSALPTFLSPRIPRLVRSCLRKDPAERLHDIAVARAEIERVLAPRRQGIESTRQLEVLESDASNLPEQFSRFIGRSRELDSLLSLSEQERLITITGTGGAGKTRLALAGAKRVFPRFPDGVWLLELASLSDVREIPQTLLRLLGVSVPMGRDPLDVLQKTLQTRELLLVVDNCEHLRDEAAALIRDLLRHAPNVHVWATSRESLGLPGESIFVLPPMALPEPDDLDFWQESESVLLFLDRARAVDRDFVATEERRVDIVRICRELDGLPLAIELAVARLRVLSLTEVAELLKHRFRLLRARNPEGIPHHQTLSELIDWSYSLLSSPEQAVFRRLSIFPADWDLSGAEEVAGDPDPVSGDPIEKWEVLDWLARLVEKSLVEADAGLQHGGRVRYRMLVSIREFAREKLEPEDRLAAAARHRLYYANRGERDTEDLNGPKQSSVLLALDLDRDNYHAAIETSLQTADLAAGVRICLALGRYWFVRGLWAAGHDYCSRMWEHHDLPLLDDNPELSRLRPNLLSLLGSLDLVRCDYAAAAENLELARELHEANGDSLAEAKALQNLGLAARQLGDVQRARECAVRTLDLYESVGSEREIAQGLHNLGNLDERAGAFTTALEHHQRALTIRRRLGDPSEIGDSLVNTGNAYKQTGDGTRAREHYREGLEVMEALGDPSGIAMAHQNLGDLCMDGALYEEARDHFDTSLDLKQELGNRSGVATTLYALGCLNLTTGSVESALEKHRESFGIRRQLGQKVAVAESLYGLATCWVSRSEHERAYLALRLALSMLDRDEMMGGELRAGIGETLSALEARLSKETVGTIERELGGRDVSSAIENLDLS